MDQASLEHLRSARPACKVVERIFYGDDENG